MLRRLSLILILFVLPFALAAKQIVIFHTSDTHGFFYPELERASGRMRGGFAAAQNVVRSEPLPHILFDSGDYSNGTAEVKDTKGAAAVKIMNAMGYAAAAAGNHEFDFGEDAFLQNLKLFQFPVLTANASLPGVKPYDFFTAGGVKIAVIGIGKEDGGKIIKFKKPQTVIKPLLEEIKKQNPGVIVLLIHDSYDGENADIAKKFPDINIILGGHAHKELQNIFVGKTLLVESGSNLKTMSKVTVDADDGGKYKSASSRLIPLYIDTAGEDKDIKQLSESLRAPGLDEPLGKTAEYISKNPVTDGCLDSPLNNWIADVMLANAKADFSVQNAGGARTSLEQGPVTQRDMINMFPFDNKTAVVTADGIFVKRLVRNGIKNGKSFYAYGSLTAKFKTKNNKIKNLEIFIAGKPVENRKTYTFAANEYIVNGNSEGWMFKRLPLENKKFNGVSIREILIKNLQQNSPLKPTAVCRLQETK